MTALVTQTATATQAQPMHLCRCTTSSQKPIKACCQLQLLMCRQGLTRTYTQCPLQQCSTLNRSAIHPSLPPTPYVTQHLPHKPCPAKRVAASQQTKRATPCTEVQLHIVGQRPRCSLCEVLLAMFEARAVPCKQVTAQAAHPSAVCNGNTDRVVALPQQSHMHD